MAAKTVSFVTDPKVHDCHNTKKPSKLMGLFTRRNCVKRSGSTDSTRESTVTSSSRYGNRRMSMIHEMQSQLPRLSLFEIHVNNSNKTPPAKPVSNKTSYGIILRPMNSWLTLTFYIINARSCGASILSQFYPTRDQPQS